MSPELLGQFLRKRNNNESTGDRKEEAKMKKRYKYGLMAAVVYLFFLLINQFSTQLNLKNNSANLEAVGFIFGIPIMPLVFTARIFNFVPALGSWEFIIYWYLFGSLFYFCVGFIIGFIRELPAKAKK